MPFLLAAACALAVCACADTPAPAAPELAAAPPSAPAPLVEVAPAPAAPDDDRRDVRALFARYRAVASAGDGAGAAALVDGSTVAYYQAALVRARTASRADLAGLPLIDRLVVLSIRHRIASEVLVGLDGRSLVAAGVAGGWIGSQGTAHMELGEVILNGDIAEAPVLVDGRPAEFSFRFRREPLGWRLDLNSVHPATEQALAAAIAESRMPADSFMVAALAQATGRPVGVEVWGR